MGFKKRKVVDGVFLGTCHKCMTGAGYRHKGHESTWWYQTCQGCGEIDSTTSDTDYFYEGNGIDYDS